MLGSLLVCPNELVAHAQIVPLDDVQKGMNCPM